jgi:3-oxoacyl-[acyl-carrier protein] reductase
MGPLDGQVALVTGTARYDGLGRGIARALAAAGADVMVTDLDPGGTRNVHESGEAEAAVGWAGLPDLVTELQGLGVRSASAVGDVGDKHDADRMVAEAIGTLGKVDILVNNAAAPHGRDRNWTWEVPEDAWDLVMRVNTRGPFLMSGAVTRHLLERRAKGRIVNISSGSGKRGYPQRAAYSASKFALIGLTQAMAQELAPHGITVNAVCPGAMATARQSYTKSDADAPGAVSPGSTIPVGRLGLPGDVARAVVFLAEPSADFITGECIQVNGGGLMV